VYGGVAEQQRPSQRTPCPSIPLGEYQRYHGMLIAPAAAHRCTRSFDHGTILFCPSGGFDAALLKRLATRSSGTRTCAKLPFLPWLINRRTLSVVVYYLLVLLSLTGLSALLGLRQDLDAREGRDLPLTLGPPQLRVPRLALDYIATVGGAAPGTRPRMVRRFEYRFQLPGIHVAMYHFVTTGSDGRERLHLVESYLGPCTWWD
jgi:hypothetical protein